MASTWVVVARHCDDIAASNVRVTRDYSEAINLAVRDARRGFVVDVYAETGMRDEHGNFMHRLVVSCTERGVTNVAPALLAATLKHTLNVTR